MSNKNNVFRLWEELSAGKNRAMRGSVMQGRGKKDVAPLRRWHLCRGQKKPTAYHLGAKCSWLREVEMQRPRVSNEPVYLRGRKKAMVPVLRREEETGIRIKLELWAKARWEHRKALHWQVLSWKWLSLIYIFKKLILKVIPPLWASVALSLRCS